MPITSLKYSPVLITSLKYTPVFITSLKYTPVLITSLKYTPVLITSLKYTPVLTTSLKYTPVLTTSLKYTRHTKHSVHDLCNVYKNHRSFKLQWTKISVAQCAVYVSDTPAALRHTRDHQTWHESVYSKLGYHHGKIEKPSLNIVGKL